MPEKLRALLGPQEVGWFDREENQSGALASRLAVDTSSIRGAVGDQLGLLFQNLVTLIAAYIIAFIASWKMTLVITATVPLIAVAGYFQAKFMLGSSKKASLLGQCLHLRGYQGKI